MTTSMIRIGFALVPDDPFWVQVRETVRQHAQQLGVTLVRCPFVEVRLGDELLGLLEDLEAQELSALITPSFSQSQMLTILEAGLPLISADETPLRHPRLVSPSGLYDAAAQAARFVAEQLKGQGHILLVGGPVQNPYTARVRLQGFRDTVVRFPDLRFTHVSTPWRYGAVYEQIMQEADQLQAVIAADPVDAIFGISDPIALAARNAGRVLGFVDDRTLIAGVNGDPLAIAAILEGTMHASAATSALDLGQKLVEFGLRAAQGEALPNTFPFSIELVTTENVAQVAARKLVDIAALPSRLVDVNIQLERQRLMQMQTSLELNRHVGSILDADELLRTLADIIGRRYAYDHVQFFMWSELEQSLLLVEPGKAAAERLRISLDEAGVLGHTLLRNQAVYIPDTLNSHRFPPDLRWPEMRARVILPVRVGGRTLGILDLHSGQRTFRNQVELDALQSLADQVGAAMRNAQLYSQALASRAEAERASQMKSRLLANISHQLRGPLNVILGYSQAALATPNPYDAKLPTELAQDLRYIERGGFDLLRLINGLLDLAQAEIGALSLYPELIDTRAFLAELFAEAEQSLAHVAEVQWKLRLPADLPPLFADPVRLRSVLLNLLDNAARFTSRGQISLSAHCNGEQLIIDVQDTGRGISDEELAHIRQRLATDFSRTQENGADIIRSGFGLNIVHHLVSVHGGQFSIESEPERGVTCRLALPLQVAVRPVSDNSAGRQENETHERTGNALVEKVYAFVAENYVAPFTREDLADALGVSETYVSRIFRRVTGTGLWEYVNHYRVSRACELLDRTAMTITEVALAVGFNDPAYFSRIFRNETGKSPQAYRKTAVSSPASSRQ